MKAFEDTKCSRSVVADTLERVTSQAQLLRDKIDLIEAGQSLGRAETIAELGKLLDACQNLRDAILSEDSAANWHSREQLNELVNRLDDVAATRRRYLDLAQSLSTGTLSHRRERTRQERLAQRDAAVAELMEISAQTSPPELPGPAVEEWLKWACSLEDGTDDPELQDLKTNFPRVDDFIRQLEIELWQDGERSLPDQERENVAVQPPQDDDHSSPSNSEELNLYGWIDTSGTQTDSTQDSEEASSTRSAHSSAVQVEDEPQNPPTAALSSVERGKLCFFAQEEVESLSRALQQSIRNPKRARKVRALVAVSQWLLPRDQNPVLHPTCGIQAQIDYTISSDLAAVSPDEVSAAIDADGALLLFTGGADLLRWSTSQPSDEPPDAIASVKRLNVDQLRAWFVEVFKIALSEPQVQDIYRLTYGVPLLVGEMHRLIIPVPDAPPTWLGYGIWTEIKARFQRRIPALRQELRNGAPSVRLTGRELSLLRMVLIASDYSTPDTIVSNLTDNWYQYHPAELPAISAADEGSVSLLQRLGLLPQRSDAGLGAIEGLLPLSPDDPIRLVVNDL